MLVGVASTAKGHKGSVNSLICMKMMNAGESCYGLCSHQTAPADQDTRMFWTNMLMLYTTLIKSSNEGILFGRKTTPVEFRDLWNQC